MSSPQAAVPSFADTYANVVSGAAIIGSWFAVSLYGLTISQTMFYVSEYPKDPVHIKAIEFTRGSASTPEDTIEVFCIPCIPHSIISAFNLEALSQNIWSLSLSVTLHYQFLTTSSAAPPKVRWALSGLNVAGVLLHAETIVHMWGKKLVPKMVFTVDDPALVAIQLFNIDPVCKENFDSTDAGIPSRYRYHARCIAIAAALVELLALSLRPGIYINALLASLNSRHRIRREGTNRTSDFHLSDRSAGASDSAMEFGTFNIKKGSLAQDVTLTVIANTLFTTRLNLNLHPAWHSLLQSNSFVKESSILSQPKMPYSGKFSADSLDSQRTCGIREVQRRGCGHRGADIFLGTKIGFLPEFTFSRAPESVQEAATDPHKKLGVEITDFILPSRLTAQHERLSEPPGFKQGV
ncbi:hypothetical protein B0H11DRAFT_2206549 [Mycena galericulata]|nr:hypothetical protein B0H11DRAFT_2206549 [Mycena galericulata]